MERANPVNLRKHRGYLQPLYNFVVIKQELTQAATAGQIQITRGHQIHPICKLGFTSS